MKTLQNKGFTLVELIVVITILAILGTIAFISLQGYSTDAKNSKVTSDLKTMSTALEAKRTQGSDALSDFLIDADATNTASLTLSGTGVATAPSTYEVGNMDFSVLGQNGTEFKDPNGVNEDYLYGYATVTGHSGYQLAGQVVENDVKQARIIWNYYPKVSGDSAWIITAATGTAASTLLTDGATIGAGTANNLY